MIDHTIRIIPRTRVFASLVFLCCVSLPAFNGCGNAFPDTREPVAVKGTLDARGWDFIEKGSLKLNGEWEFCWNRLLEPRDFADKAAHKECGFTKVPGLWKRHKIGGAPLPGEGHATYRLKLLTGPDTRVKTLNFQRVLSSYKLWINGALVDQKGTKSIKAREDYVYVHNTRQSSFVPAEGGNEIILQVFNHEYESGGIDSPLRLEDGEISARSAFRNYTVNMIIVGLLLSVSIYNILLYFFRREDLSPLYFGLMGLALTINTYNIQAPILSGGSSYPWNPFLINHVTLILGTFFVIHLFKSLFPDDLPTRVVRFSEVVAIGLIVPLLFTGFRTSEKIMQAFFFAVFLYILYNLYLLVKTMMNRREDAVLFSLGFLAIYLAGLNSIMFALWIIDTGNMTHYGMVVFSFTTTMVISRRFARAHRSVEKLSKDLESKNIELQNLDRLKDQFLASTSHELRTPLHGMIGLTEALLDGASGGLPSKAIENLSLIASSGQRLAGMVNDLLDMAKMQEEDLGLNLRSVDLRALCDSVVMLSGPLAGAKRLEILNRIGPGLPRALADEDRIRQVLHNLVGNAIKFTHEGAIELSARVLEGREDDRGGGAAIEVSVSDTGIGVPDKFKEMIFEPYRQVDGGDTRSFPGTGLGLAIAKRIIELHGGVIRVASGGAGGSVFSFTLPVANEPSADAPEDIVIECLNDAAEDAREGFQSPADTSEIDFDGNPVFLVVDDDPVNVRVIQSCFESKRCSTLTAFDGISALNIIERGDPVDLVLLDIMMSEMSGYDVCRRIRAVRRPDELPVIMVTAKNMIFDIDAAFEAGANDYIVKPFHRSELLTRVSTMLKLRSIRRSASRGITIRCGNREYSLPFDDIIYVTSHSKNIVIHTREQDIQSSVLLKSITERLPQDMFIRIHKRHIINVRYVHSISHYQSGRYRVRLNDADDTELPVGSAHLESLKKNLIPRYRSFP